MFAERGACRTAFCAGGSEARIGEVVVARGARLGYAELAMAAQVGRATVRGYAEAARRDSFDGRRMVGIEQEPGRFQIRNTNSISLAAQVTLAGGEP